MSRIPSLQLLCMNAIRYFLRKDCEELVFARQSIFGSDSTVTCVPAASSQLVMSAGEPIPHQNALLSIFKDVMKLLQESIDQKTPDGYPKYVDVCEWMSAQLSTQTLRDEYVKKLQDLESLCCSSAGADPILDFQTKKFAGGGKYEKRPLRLWQLGVQEDCHVKGAPPLHAVRDNMQKFLTGFGNETEKYPLKVLFEWCEPMPDSSRPAGLLADGILPLSVSLSTGSSVTMASHLVCWGVLQLGLDLSTFEKELRKDISERILKCIRVLAETCCPSPSTQRHCSPSYLDLNLPRYFCNALPAIECGVSDNGELAGQDGCYSQGQANCGQHALHAFDLVMLTCQGTWLCMLCIFRYAR